MRFGNKDGFSVEAKVILERDNNFDHGPYYAHAFNTEGNDAMVSTGQQGAVESLERHAKDAGVKFYYDHIGRQLIREDNNKGRVTGAIAQRADGSYVKFVGKKAIVLATGEFSADKEMLASFRRIRNDSPTTTPMNSWGTTYRRCMSL